jgi:hypothetical protein
MKISSFVLIFISAMACSPSIKNAPDQQSTVFSYYLKTSFNDSIPDEEHIYILVPALGCKGCRAEALAVLHHELIKSGKKNVSYIFSSSVNPSDSVVEPFNMQIDSSGLIDKINLPVSNIAIIKTANGKVISLTSIRSETTDSIASILRE